MQKRESPWAFPSVQEVSSRLLAFSPFRGSRFSPSVEPVVSVGSEFTGICSSPSSSRPTRVALVSSSRERPSPTRAAGAAMPSKCARDTDTRLAYHSEASSTAKDRIGCAGVRKPRAPQAPRADLSRAETVRLYLSLTVSARLASRRITCFRKVTGRQSHGSCLSRVPFEA
jgi:hypothetical protein